VERKRKGLRPQPKNSSRGISKKLGKTKMQEQRLCLKLNKKGEKMGREESIGMTLGGGRRQGKRGGRVAARREKGSARDKNERGTR